MSNQIRLWLLISMLYISSISIIDVLVNISIYQQTNSFEIVGSYMLFYFGGMFIGSLVITLLSSLLGVWILIILSTFLNLVSPIVMIFSEGLFFENFSLIAILSGLGYISFMLLSGAVSYELTNENNSAKYFSYINSEWQLSYLLIPVAISALSIFQIQKFYIFVAGVLFTLIAFILSVVFFINKKEKYEYNLTLKDLSPDLNLSLFLNTLNGARQGVFWAFLGAATLSLVDSLSTWGTIMAILQVIQILISLIAKNIKQTDWLMKTFLTSGIFYSFFLVLFLIEVNLIVFLSFMLLNSIYTAVFNVAHARATYSIYLEDNMIRKHSFTYSFLTEFSTGLGRVIILIIFLPVFSRLLEFDTVPIYLIFVLASFTPHLYITLIKSNKRISNQFGV